jgi:hypothetical protein
MFQEQPEMGLFTFYWEATHSDRKERHHSHRSEMLQPEEVKRVRAGAGMEEK